MARDLASPVSGAAVPNENEPANKADRVAVKLAVKAPLIAERSC